MVDRSHMFVGAFLDKMHQRAVSVHCRLWVRFCRLSLTDDRLLKARMAGNCTLRICTFVFRAYSAQFYKALLYIGIYVYFRYQLDLGSARNER